MPRPKYLAHWLKRWIVAAIAVFCCVAIAAPVQAFCGFFVAKADSRLTNTASQVVIARSGNRSIFMMANDFQGDIRDFARIVPVPVIPRRDQVRIGDGALMEKLNAFTAPRLAQYFDRPCRQEHQWYRIIAFLAIPVIVFFIVSWLRPNFTKLGLLIGLLAMAILVVAALPSFLNQANKAGSNQLLSQGSAVIIEDQFTVGEYDVAILSATESEDLVTWLQQNNYQVGSEATAMLQSYIDTGMKFFVVRVNLAVLQQQPGQFLRPIVLDYESDQFVLPIRLGTLNASADQDLIVHILSPEAYVETANYETIPVPTDAESQHRWPSGRELPAFVQDEFRDFYDALFRRVHQRHQDAAFLEYATRTFGGNIKCDPCTVDAESLPTPADLKAMGAWWSDESPETLITRLHVRYSAATFPEDLQFRQILPEQLAKKPELWGRSFPQWAGVDFQARYVIRRPMGSAICTSRWRYRRKMSQTAENLATLTGWDVAQIRQKMAIEQRLNALDVDGQTKLHRAIIAGDIAKAAALIEQGANVNLVGNQGWGMTPLGSAIANNQPKLIQLLLKNGANPDGLWRGEPLLLWAIGYSDLTTVQLLLEAGIQPSTIETVWETAQVSGNDELIKLLRPYVDAE